MEKYYRNQLKKIKKQWPSHIRPYLLPNGQLRLVKSHDGEALHQLGIVTAEDIFNHQFTGKEVLSSEEEKLAKRLAALISEMQSASPETFQQILTDYFPNILERLSFPQ